MTIRGISTRRLGAGMPMALPLIILLLIIPGARCGTNPASAEPLTRQATAVSTVALMETYGQLPLSFEENRGQTDAQVKFLARGLGYTLFLTATEAVLALRHPDAARTQSHQTRAAGRALRMQFLHATTSAHIAGYAALPGKSHYLLGNDPQQWRTDISTYAQVEYRDIYPGVTLVYYGNQRCLEYDLMVAPGADPGAIALRFDGALGLRIDAQGNLFVDLGDGELRLQKPRVYQEWQGVRQLLEGRYLVRDNQEVGFQVAAYDRSRVLVIDPPLDYSTYLGGTSADEGIAIAVDSGGNAYVTGVTIPPKFPTTPEAFQPAVANGPDAYVTKLNATGSAVYSTHLGGTGVDEGFGIAVDSTGNAYVTGQTSSPNFPTTPGAFQPAFAGGGFDTFVTKLNAAGSALVYSTYLGGTSFDFGFRIAVDSAGNAYATGYTDSRNFPTTPGAFQRAVGGALDAFVTKLNATGSALVYSTYLGGTGAEYDLGIAVDSGGNAYVTGHTDSRNFPTTPDAFQPALAGADDAFVTKLNATGSALVYSTYLGGTSADQGFRIAVDSAGNAYVTGFTDSPDFPTTPGAFQSALANGPDAFVTKLNATGSALVYSTYLGGTSADQGFGIAVDSAGNAYVTGVTGSPNFPTTPGAFQSAVANGPDAFVTKLNATGALVYSTYLGGTGADQGFGIAVDSAGNAYVTGQTSSPNFPTTPGVFQPALAGSGDAFVTKLGAQPVVLTGRAFDVQTALPAQRVAVEDTGEVYSPTPQTVGHSSVTVRGALVNGTGLTATVTTEVTPTAKSTAVAELMDATVAVSPAIHVQGVHADSTTTCAGSAGSTTIAFLQIGSTIVGVSVGPLPQNVRPPGFPIDGIDVVLNEQIPLTPATNPQGPGLLVNAVHVTTPSSNVVIGSARSDIHLCP